jgi:prepilin-type N-terminal cleavage/methylation domain-containing protein
MRRKVNNKTPRVLASWRYKKSLSGFTLMEMMIALSITSLVVAIAISAYMIINKQFINFQHQSEDVNNIYQFINTFENDLNKYQLKKITPDSIILQNYSNTLYYNFGPSVVSRSILGKKDIMLSSVPNIKISKTNISMTEGIINIKLYLRYDTLMFRAHYTNEETLMLKKRINRKGARTQGKIK